MNIREAKIDDYVSIQKLNRNGLGYDYPVEKTKEKLQIVLALPSDKIFVAECDNSIIGYIHLEGYECTYCDSIKNILGIVVEENYRQKGVGRALIRQAEKWAKESGSIGIRLTSGFSRTIAHEFYQSCGYRYKKDQKNFFKLF